MSDLHDDYVALSVTRAGDISPEDEVIALAARARRQKASAVKGPRQYCNVCVRSVPLVYDRVENRGNTVEYIGTCPVCGTRHTVSEKKRP